MKKAGLLFFLLIAYFISLAQNSILQRNSINIVGSSNIVNGTYLNYSLGQNYTCTSVTDNFMLRGGYQQPPYKNYGIITGNVILYSDDINSSDILITLFKIENSTQLNPLYSTILDTNFFFSISNINAGNYILLTNFSNPSFTYLKTYFDSTYLWNRADTLRIANNSTINLRVPLYKLTALTEIPFGSISGKLQYINSDKSILGEPVKGAEIYIELEPDDEPILNTTTDSSGYYSFSNLPENNFYKINIDIPGIPLISTYESLSFSDENNITNLNFFVDTTTSGGGIWKDSSLFADYIFFNLNKINIFPNPTNGLLSIKYQVLKTTPLSIDIIDVFGKNLLTVFSGVKQEGFFEEKISLDKEISRSGYLFIKIKFNNNVCLKKIIIN